MNYKLGVRAIELPQSNEHGSRGHHKTSSRIQMSQVKNDCKENRSQLQQQIYLFLIFWKRIILEKLG